VGDERVLEYEHSTAYEFESVADSVIRLFWMNRF
jgi:hypothetical protein